MSEKLRPGQKLKLTTVDELLGVPNGESAVEIEISKIVPFKEHPFKVLDDDKMKELIESVRINGVFTPVLVRQAENGMYEMISGHRRMHAAELVELTLIPAIVRDMTDDEATIAMVDANIQREELLPSEKAFAFKMKMDAIKWFEKILKRHAKIIVNEFSQLYNISGSDRYYRAYAEVQKSNIKEKGDKSKKSVKKSS